MGTFQITGRRAVGGVHRVPGNKNAALPMIAAALLTDEPVTLENVPDIADVRLMLAFAQRFGAKVARDLESRTATVTAKRLKSVRLDPALARKIRTSILFAGPLLARTGSVCLPPPGGDGIGHRRLDTHFDGFASLGAACAVFSARFFLLTRLMCRSSSPLSSRPARTYCSITGTGQE